MLGRIEVLIVAIVLGAALGSFACCMAQRIRLKEKGKKDPGERSVCLHCGARLRWFENIPIVSWLAQRGRCRHCGKKIGSAEIWAELAGAGMFGMLGWKTLFDSCVVMNCTFPNRNFLAVGILAVFLVVALVLAIYDAKWQELPLKLLIALIVLGACVFAISLSTVWGWEKGMRELILGTVGGVGILGGMYFLLSVFSKGRLVGDGDWMLGVAMGLVLGDWWLAIWTLFLANFVGAMVMLPQKKKKIAFGPFLVGAFVVVLCLKNFVAGLI